MSKSVKFAAAGIILAASIAVSACGSTTTVVHDAPTVTAAAPVVPAAQNIIVNNNPAPSPVTSTVYVPPATVTDPNGNVCLSFDTAGYCPGYDPAPPVSDAYSIVSAYYSDINTGDSTDAWNMLGPVEQAGWNYNYNTYASWVSGVTFSGLSEDYAAFDTATASYTETDSAGTYAYTVTFNVNNGIITSDNWSTNY
jgi:hypothetical protein